MGKSLIDWELVAAFKYFGTVTFTLAGSMLGGFFLGLYLDRRFGTDPWLSILCFFLGAGGGFWNIYKLVMKDAKKGNKK